MGPPNAEVDNSSRRGSRSELVTPKHTFESELGELEYPLRLQGTSAHEAGVGSLRRRISSDLTRRLRQPTGGMEDGLASLGEARGPPDMRHTFSGTVRSTLQVAGSHRFRTFDRGRCSFGSSEVQPSSRRLSGFPLQSRNSRSVSSWLRGRPSPNIVVNSGSQDFRAIVIGQGQSRVETRQVTAGPGFQEGFFKSMPPFLSVPSVAARRWCRPPHQSTQAPQLELEPPSAKMEFSAERMHDHPPSLAHLLAKPTHAFERDTCSTTAQPEGGEEVT